jgi:hypothetical protein
VGQAADGQQALELAADLAPDVVLIDLVAAGKASCWLMGGAENGRVMHFTWTDGLATPLVAAAVVLYALWATNALMPGVSTRWMTVIAFALGVAAWTASQRELGELYGAPGRSAPIRLPPDALESLASRQADKVGKNCVAA